MIFYIKFEIHCEWNLIQKAGGMSFYQLKLSLLNDYIILFIHYISETNRFKSSLIYVGEN